MKHKQTQRSSDRIIKDIKRKIRNVLDVSDFKHYRINHSKLFAEGRNHINGIENFWNQTN